MPPRPYEGWEEGEGEGVESSSLRIAATIYRAECTGTVVARYSLQLRVGALGTITPHAIPVLGVAPFGFLPLSHPHRERVKRSNDRMEKLTDGC